MKVECVPYISFVKVGSVPYIILFVKAGSVPTLFCL